MALLIYLMRMAKSLIENKSIYLEKYVILSSDKFCKILILIKKIAT